MKNYAITLHIAFTLTLLLLLFPVAPGFAFNKPHVINLKKEDYSADNKNWAIGEDERGVYYFGNDVGLLEFDGVTWNLYNLPNSPVCRSVAVLSHQTIFSGSYEEFGRWDRDVSGKLVYTSLSADIDKSKLANDDFWRIWITRECVYFQSFSNIYVYDYQTVSRMPLNMGFLFLSQVRDEFLAQQIMSPLFRIKRSGVEKVDGSEMFNNTDIRVILPYEDDKYLIGTATQGIYIYDGTHFYEWSKSLSQTIIQADLNCGLLSSRGTYFFGTILNGIYEVNTDGEIIEHISSDNYLQNNTVLSLYEDSSHNIWAALDRGLSYIRYIPNMACYTDLKGNMGAVYSAAFWKGRLYIGTNQGVFYLEEAMLNQPNSLSKLRLINGTQGQVWKLKVIDDRLFCCHNKGLKEIMGNLDVKEIRSIVTGVYDISAGLIHNENVLLLSTYYSTQILNKRNNTLHTVEGISQPIVRTEEDHLGNLWAEHFTKGVYRCKLGDGTYKPRNIIHYGGGNGDGLPYKLKLFKIGGRIVLLGDDRFYTYDDIADRIVDDGLLNECFKEIRNMKQIIPVTQNNFWAIAKNSIYLFYYDGYEAYITEHYSIGMGLSLINAYENISVLNDTTSLVCLDNGFLMHNFVAKNEHYKPIIPTTPLWESLQTKNINSKGRFVDMKEQDIRIKYDYNTVNFKFTAPRTFTQDLYFQYKLKNVDNDWSLPQKIDQVSYARLPKGSYQFSVRTINTLGDCSDVTSIDFEILPPWYQTGWAYLLYFLLIATAFYVVRLLIIRRNRNLILRRIRTQETYRLKTLTGKLQTEVEQKNAELVTLTSFIIQKNELLQKIKDTIEHFYKKNKHIDISPLYQKTKTLLNSNLNSENDWKAFLLKFEEKHTDFFKKLKSLYPQLTTNDLRMCACLRLNLDSKEIASLMSISIRAVENSRYRLRKKMGLKPSQNLNEVFLEVD